MKETIYTIPINEAFDNAEGCPFCYLAEKTENTLMERATGASMMEVDFRKKTNEKGFCKAHYKSLAGRREKLPLALIMESHIKELINILETEKLKDTEKEFLKKSSSCLICEQTEETLSRYYKAFFSLYKEKEFKEKAFSKPFCVEHFAKLLSLSGRYLSIKKSKEFKRHIISHEEKLLSSLHTDISSFCRKFHYDKNNINHEGAIDAVPRGAEIL